MKYFLFKENFPYYGLIVADTKEDARQEYIDVISDLDEDEDEDPLELSVEEALKEIEKSDFESEEEKTKIIEAIQGDGFIEKEVLLIDTSLLE